MYVYWIEVHCFLGGISHVFCSSEDLFRADLRGERKSDIQPPFSPSLPKTETKPGLFERETVFAHWGSIPKCTELYLGVFLLSESEGTLLASAPSRPDVPALKELGVANSSVSRTVFKSASSLPFWYPVEMTAQCWQQYNVRTTGLSHLCYRESFN